MPLMPMPPVPMKCACRVVVNMLGATFKGHIRGDGRAAEHDRNDCSFLVNAFRFRTKVKLPITSYGTELTYESVT